MAAVASAASLMALPAAGLLARIQGHLPAAAWLPIVDQPAGAAIALLLPLAFDRLLDRLDGAVRAGLLLDRGAGGRAALWRSCARDLDGCCGRSPRPSAARRAGPWRQACPCHREALALAGLADSVTDGRLTVDADGDVLTADARALELLGGQPVGRSIFRYLPRLAADGLTIDELAGRRLETELQHESSAVSPGRGRGHATRTVAVARICA